MNALAKNNTSPLSIISARETLTLSRLPPLPHGKPRVYGCAQRDPSSPPQRAYVSVKHKGQEERTRTKKCCRGVVVVPRFRARNAAPKRVRDADVISYHIIPRPTEKFFSIRLPPALPMLCVLRRRSHPIPFRSIPGFRDALITTEDKHVHVPSSPSASASLLFSREEAACGFFCTAGSVVLLLSLLVRVSSTSRRSVDRSVGRSGSVSVRVRVLSR